MSMLLLTMFLLAASPSDRLAVIRDAPDFALTTQASAPLRLSDLRGQVVLVSFVFTTCNGTCPATTHRMSQVAGELRRNGLLKDGQMKLLTVTLDPARDTPAALKRYMELYEIDPAHWSFLTGEPADVARVHSAWGMWVKPGPMGQLDHPSRVFLLDRRGRIREIYNLDFFKPAWVLEDVKALLDEQRK